MGSVYIGYGIDIKCEDLAKILDINAKFSNENRKEFIKNMMMALRKNPIMVSKEPRLKLQIVDYNHRNAEYSEGIVSIGVFKYIHRANEFTAEEKLLAIMQKDFDMNIFAEMFGTENKPEFKIIFDTCYVKSCSKCL